MTLTSAPVAVLAALHSGGTSRAFLDCLPRVFRAGFLCCEALSAAPAAGTPPSDASIQAFLDWLVLREVVVLCRKALTSPTRLHDASTQAFPSGDLHAMLFPGCLGLTSAPAAQQASLRLEDPGTCLKQSSTQAFRECLSRVSRAVLLCYVELTSAPVSWTRPNDAPSHAVLDWLSHISGATFQCCVALI